MFQFCLGTRKKFQVINSNFERNEKCQIVSKLTIGFVGIYGLFLVFRNLSASWFTENDFQLVKPEIVLTSVVILHYYSLNKANSKRDADIGKIINCNGIYGRLL